MTLIHQKKKRHPIAFIVGAICIVSIIVFIYLFILKNDGADSPVSNLEAEITSETLLEEDIEMTTEYRGKSKEYYIDYVVVGDEQETDKFLDIRIRFPNGEDYIVTEGKTITYMTDKGFYMYLDEKEVQMLSSARTDVEVYEGAMLYLSSYDKKLENGLTDYPINLFVLSYYGQYFENAEEIYNKRIQLEENLIAFMNQTLQK